MVYVCWYVLILVLYVRFQTHLNGGFHKWGCPNSWMVYNGKSHLRNSKNGWFWGTPILGNLQTKAHPPYSGPTVPTAHLRSLTCHLSLQTHQPRQWTITLLGPKQSPTYKGMAIRISNFSVWFHALKSKTTIRYKNSDDMLRWPGITRLKNTTTTTPSGLNGVPRPSKSSNMFAFKTDNTNTHINCIL